MEWILPIVSLLVFSGLLFYFRWTDAKNADLRSLHEYIRSVEKKIEQFLRAKEKDFNDKMIPAEIAIDRMNNLAQILQKKAEDFDQYLDEGERIYRDLRQEMGSIGGSLKEYRRMRTEFEDIEHKITEIIAMRDMVAEGSGELDRLRSDMKNLKSEYDGIMTQLTTSSKTELEAFFNTMQADLSAYLTKAQRELSETDGEIREKIEDLHRSTADMSIRMGEFKETAEEGIVGLKAHFHEEITVLRGMAESNVAEIIDRWTELKERTELDREGVENALQGQREFFSAERERVQEEIRIVHTTLETALAERIQELGAHGVEIQEKLKFLENGLRTHLETGLEEKVLEVRKELEQTQKAFAAQEEELAQKLEELSAKAGARIKTCEDDFYGSVEHLQNRVHTVAEKAEKILLAAEEKIDKKMDVFSDMMREKVNENMQNLEERFRSENDERLKAGIEEITNTLEEKYINAYRKTFEDISATASLLEEQVGDKISAVDGLDKNLKEIREAFAKEKENILLMAQGLSENRDRHIREVEDYLEKTVDILQNDLHKRIAEHFEENLRVQKQDQEDWGRRYGETLLEARTSFNAIKDGIDGIARDLKDIENKTLTTLKEESERFLEDTSRRLEDLKREAEVMNRENKDVFSAQLETARKAVGELKQELWNQENKVRDQAQKDFDRLGDRIRDYDRRLSEFIKKTEVLERLEGAAEKFQGRMQELENLKKDLERISSDLSAARNSGQSTVAELKMHSDVLENSLSLLGSTTEQAKFMRDSLDNSLGEAQKLGDFLAHLETEKENAQKIEDLLLQNLQRYEDLREALDELDSRKAKVDEMLLNIDSVNRMMGSTAEISDKIADLGHYAVGLQQQIAAMQEDLASAVADKNNLRTAIEKVTDLDSLVHHVEQERQSVEKMLQYVAKTSHMLKNSAGSGAFASNEDSPEQVKRIMNLYRKNWSIGEIADTLKLSPVFVEMTIDKHK